MVSDDLSDRKHVSLERVIVHIGLSIVFCINIIVHTTCLNLVRHGQVRAAVGNRTLTSLLRRRQNVSPVCAYLKDDVEENETCNEDLD